MIILTDAELRKINTHLLYVKDLCHMDEYFLDGFNDDIKNNIDAISSILRK